MEVKNMMKVCFVNLNDYTGWSKSFTVGQLNLAKILNDEGYDTEVIDFVKLYNERTMNLEDKLESNIENDVQYLLSLRPDVISIYTMCNNYHIALLLSSRIKELNSKVKVLLAGPQATLTAKDTLENFEYVDLIGLGEGEDNITQILWGIKKGDFTSADGIGYRDGKEVKIKWDKTKKVDLDRLPMPDQMSLSVKNGERIIIEAGRGCPYSCTYCSTRNFWGNQYRLKSIDRLISEIKFYVQRFDSKSFSFQHDLFTANKSYIREFCKRLGEEALDIEWTCSSRVDTLDDNLVSIMARHGCREIFLGIETGSERVQALVKKNLDLTKVMPLIDSIIQYKIVPTCSFIYGFPTEDKEDLNKTIKLMYDIRKKCLLGNNKVSLQLWPLNFLSGTEITESYYDNLVLNKREGYSFNYVNAADSSQSDRLFSKFKSIFIGHYSLEASILDETENLNSFYMSLLNNAYKHLSLTIDYLISLYQEDFYAFFQAVKRCAGEDLESIFIVNIISEKTPYQLEVYRMINIIKRFIRYEGLCKEDTLLAELLSFEENSFNIIFSKENFLIEQEYTFDVFSMKKEKRIIAERQQTVLRFVKYDGNSRITKVI